MNIIRITLLCILCKEGILESANTPIKPSFQPPAASYGRQAQAPVGCTGRRRGRCATILGGGCTPIGCISACLGLQFTGNVYPLVLLIGGSGLGLAGIGCFAYGMYDAHCRPPEPVRSPERQTMIDTRNITVKITSPTNSDSSQSPVLLMSPLSPNSPATPLSSPDLELP